MESQTESFLQILKRKTEPRRRISTLKRIIRNPISNICADSILVLGNQKSGTTAVAALLARRAQVKVQLDIHDVHIFLDVLEQRGIEFAMSRFRSGFDKKIIKEPNLTFCCEQVRSALRPEHTIFIVRHPLSNIRSILSRLSFPGHLPSLDDAAIDGVPYIWREIIRGRWTPRGANYIETLALRWKQAALAYLNNEREMILLRYEDFCCDKQNSIDQLVSSVNLKPHADISGQLNHQFQPKGTKSQSWHDIFGQNLELIRNTCGVVATEFGYSLDK